MNEASLRRIVRSYFQYYEHSRTHLALAKDAPESRAIQPPAKGVVVELRRWVGCIIDASEELPESTQSFRTIILITPEQPEVSCVAHRYYRLKLFASLSQGSV